MGVIRGYYTRDGVVDVCVIISPRDKNEMRQRWEKLTRLEKLHIQFCIDEFTGEYNIHKLARMLGYTHKKQLALREALKKEQKERANND